MRPSAMYQIVVAAFQQRNFSLRRNYFFAGAQSSSKMPTDFG